MVCGSQPPSRRFLEHIEAALVVVCESPGRFRSVTNGVRRARILGFPYLFYFVVHPTVIDVIGALHCARDPRVWMERG